MNSYSHWGMFPCWEQGLSRSYDAAGMVEAYYEQGGIRPDPVFGLPPMVEQPKSWVHVPIGGPCGFLVHQQELGHEFQKVLFDNVWDLYVRDEPLTPHEDDLKLTIVK